VWRRARGIERGERGAEHRRLRASNEMRTRREDLHARDGLVVQRALAVGEHAAAEHDVRRVVEQREVAQRLPREERDFLGEPPQQIQAVM